MDTKSVETIVSSRTCTANRNLELISHNTEALILTIFGIIGTTMEVAGYWPTMRLRELFQEDELKSDLKVVIYKFSKCMDDALFYSIHIYLAAYILLPYPLLMEKNSSILAPWLICGALRSILLKLLIALAGVVLCSLHGRIHTPCLQYSTFYGAEICISLYMWVSVNNFYNYLQTKSLNNIQNVIKTIHEAGIRGRLSCDLSPSSTLLPVNIYDDDDFSDDSQAALVERAAFAWIARELLENGAEYVSDSQFSQYLTMKATMELRHILKEFEEKNRNNRKRSSRPVSMQERMKNTLEFSTRTSEHQESSLKSNYRINLFKENVLLSTYDSNRHTKVIKSSWKLFENDKDFFHLEEREITSTHCREYSDEDQTVEVQTDPLPPIFSSMSNFSARKHFT